MKMPIEEVNKMKASTAPMMAVWEYKKSIQGNCSVKERRVLSKDFKNDEKKKGEKTKRGKKKRERVNGTKT
jgi:hypothetical protein